MLEDGKKNLKKEKKNQIIPCQLNSPELIF